MTKKGCHKPRIATEHNTEIPRKKFEESLTQRINSFSEEKAQELLGRDLSFLTLAPFNEDLQKKGMNFSRHEDMIDLKAVLYAQKQNNKAITNWLASLGLYANFALRTSLCEEEMEGFDVIRVRNKYELFKNVFDKKFFGKKTQAYFDLPREVKGGKTFFHLLNNAKSVNDGIQKVQNHFGGGKKLERCLVERLKNDYVDLIMYRPNPLSKRPSQAYFLITKEKTAHSIAEKISLKLAESNLVAQSIPSFELGCAKIKDFYGFAINTQEYIDPEYSKEEYERSTVNRIKQFYANNPFVNMLYASRRDNYYRNDKRDMKGIQMYIAPNELAIEAGLVLPFPRVAGNPVNFENIFPISLHIQDAKAYAEGQLGGYGIKPQIQYKDTEKARSRDFLKRASPEIKRSLIRNTTVIKEVHDLEPLFLHFELGNGSTN